MSMELSRKSIACKEKEEARTWNTLVSWTFDAVVKRSTRIHSFLSSVTWSISCNSKLVFTVWQLTPSQVNKLSSSLASLTTALMTAYTISGKQAIFFIGGAMPMLSKCEDSNKMNSSKEYFKKKETNKEAIHKGVYSTSPVATPIISVKTIRIFINRLWRRLMREVSTRSKSPRLRFLRYRPKTSFWA